MDFYECSNGTFSPRRHLYESPLLLANFVKTTKRLKWRSSMTDFLGRLLLHGKSHSWFVPLALFGPVLVVKAENKSSGPCPNISAICLDSTNRPRCFQCYTPGCTICCVYLSPKVDFCYNGANIYEPFPGVKFPPIIRFHRHRTYWSP